MNMMICDHWSGDRDIAIAGVGAVIATEETSTMTNRVIREEELPSDICEWLLVPRKKDRGYILRLEAWTDVSKRISVQGRNIHRLLQAQHVPNLHHLQVHYSCCLDPDQRKAMIDLSKSSVSPSVQKLTMHAINSASDWFRGPTQPHDWMEEFFGAYQRLHVLNLNSSPIMRGHGLDTILKSLEGYHRLHTLRLQGWQWDRVSVDTFIHTLQMLQDLPQGSPLRVLSLRASSFLGRLDQSIFERVVDALVMYCPNLETLNMSYCGLKDHDIIYAINKLQGMKSLTKLHLGGNQCKVEASVVALSDWIASPPCQLSDLNLRALWTSYSDEHGLLHRAVDLSLLYDSLRYNTSVQSLSLSENNLVDLDIQMLTSALKERQRSKLPNGESRPVLNHLDVSDNPFSMQCGARSLLHLVSESPWLECIHFENIYLPYGETASKIHFLTKLHRLQTLLQSQSDKFKNLHDVSSQSGVPLNLWPNFLARLQKDSPTEDCHDDVPSMSHFAPDLIFYSLQSTSGLCGLPVIQQLLTPE